MEGQGFVNRLTRSSSGTDNVIVTVPGDAARASPPDARYRQESVSCAEVSRESATTETDPEPWLPRVTSRLVV
jgi:hypothetical protein